MNPRPGRHPAARAPRVRGAGYWAIGIGAVGLLGCAFGALELRAWGTVSLRSGHAPATGAEAVRLLVFAGAVSGVFVACGFLLVWRARRISARRRTGA